MIKAAMVTDDGKDLVMIGLSEENVKRLKEGDPALIDMKELGMDGSLMIFFGETEESMMNELKESYSIRSIHDHRKEH